MSALYEDIINLFVRPYRQQYTNYDLGSVYLDNFGKRIDFEIKNHKNNTLQCSYYLPINKPNVSQCVLYLHSMNGSRLEALIGSRLPQYFLRHQDTSFATIDLSGSGNSEGQYVSLGCHESQDAIYLLQHLHRTYKIKRFVVWGRSMGAATAIKVAQIYNSHNHSSATSSPRQPFDWQLNCLVLDSPFCSVSELAVQIADKKVNIPSFVIKAGFMLIKKSIQQKADFKFEDLEMEEIVSKIERTPMMLIASKEDELITFRHSQRIYRKYKCPDKQLVVISGGHNEFRTEQLIQSIVKYSREKLAQGFRSQTRKKTQSPHRTIMSNRELIIRSKNNIQQQEHEEYRQEADAREQRSRDSEVFTARFFPTSNLIEGDHMFHEEEEDLGIFHQRDNVRKSMSSKSEVSIRGQKNSDNLSLKKSLVSAKILSKNTIHLKTEGRRDSVPILSSKSEKKIRTIDLSPYTKQRATFGNREGKRRVIFQQKQDRASIKMFQAKSSKLILSSTEKVINVSFKSNPVLQLQTQKIANHNLSTDQPPQLQTMRTQQLSREPHHTPAPQFPIVSTPTANTKKIDRKFANCKSPGSNKCIGIGLSQKLIEEATSDQNKNSAIQYNPPQNPSKIIVQPSEETRKRIGYTANKPTVKNSLLLSSVSSDRKIQIKDHHNVIYSKLNNMRRKNNQSHPCAPAAQQTTHYIREEQQFVIHNNVNLQKLREQQIHTYTTPIKNSPLQHFPATLQHSLSPYNKNLGTPRTVIYGSPIIGNSSSTIVVQKENIIEYYSPQPPSQVISIQNVHNSGSPRVPYLISNERKRSPSKSQKKHQAGVNVTTKDKIKINIPQFTL